MCLLLLGFPKYYYQLEDTLQDQHLIGNPRLNISRRLFCSAVHLLHTTQEVSGSIPGRSSFFLCLFSAKSCKGIRTSRGRRKSSKKKHEQGQKVNRLQNAFKFIIITTIFMMFALKIDAKT